MRTARPAQNVVPAFLVAIASMAVLAWVPPFVGFGLAVTVAVGWCLWLERHPTT